MITVEIIASKEFSHSAQGYDVDEVNAFLDEICDHLDELDLQKEDASPVIDRSELDKKDTEIARLQQLLKQAQHEAAEAKAKLALAPKSEATQNAERATQLLVNAQKLYETTISEANNIASDIKAKAQAEADKAISGLAGTRDSLKLEIEDLKKGFGEYQVKIKEFLNEQRQHLEDSEKKFK